MTVIAPEGWSAGQLGDFIELKRGYDLPSRERRDGPFPIVSSSGPSGTHVEAKVKGPGVVTGRYGTIGQVFFVEGDYWPLNTALYVRDFKGSDPRFVSYFLRSIDFNKYVDKAAVPGVNRNHVHLEEVAFPPLDEQRRIAAVLGALDDKIALNRKMNRTLEEMAQAIFKSWFIDFDGHNDLVDSEIGPVPRGWEVGSPDAFVEFDPTIPLRKATEAVYADMKAIPTSGPAVSEWTRRAYAGGTRFQQGDTLLARITPCLENGKSALVDFLADGEVAFGSTEFIVLRPRPGVPRVWPYCLVRHEPFRAHAIANMTGSSGRQRVSAGALLGFRLAVPPAEVLRRFGAVSDPLFERITANTRESTTLASLRDALLPKLISGEVRVPETQGLVEAAS